MGGVEVSGDETLDLLGSWVKEGSHSQLMVCLIKDSQKQVIEVSNT